MDLVLPREARFVRTPDGSVWVASTSDYAFWSRYLSVFDQVHVIARVREVERQPSGWLRSDGPGVQFVPLPYYVGPSQYLRHYFELRRRIERSICAGCAVLLRLPGQLGWLARASIRDGRPYGVEVVGDPADVYAAGAVRHPLRSVFRWKFTRDLQRAVGGATAVSYVTEEVLQRRYPHRTGSFATHYSSIDLHDTAFVQRPRRYDSAIHDARCVMVGSLDQLYKGPDTLIDAIAICRSEGTDITAVFVGDGRYRPDMESYAKKRGVSENIVFRGKLPSGEPVRSELDAADFFVLPSRTEGLPRAMIEAMARGLPCIGTNVGGIPELLPPQDRVEPNNPTALARKMRDVLDDPSRMAAMSARNLEKSRSYGSDFLRARRLDMYTYLKRATIEWQAARRP